MNIKICKAERYHTDGVYIVNRLFPLIYFYVHKDGIRLKNDTYIDYKIDEW